MATVSPLRIQRLVALALCWAWGVISGSVGLNALINANRSQTRLRKASPPGVTIKFNVNDIYQPGVVLTTICAVVTLLATIFFIVTLTRPKHATGSLKIQALIFSFFSLWLFATQIPYTVFVANHHAKITAFLEGVQLPPQIVQAGLATLGASDKYSKLHPAVLLAVFPWIALLFNIILVVVLLTAARRRDRLETTSQSSISQREKASI
ncbi:hypothetical protein B0F90DRAFT_1723965 [Multifurca ochricompacta]|uniref:Uncharacterized protein n=1 Tax=Multifurca ochricompacta TaxID=376703 RepID=A0AAD4M391_9AGAM|nr:hypothetical protein B0F90DRAFT_1723965 [Multifurca ochricompacta]